MWRAREGKPKPHSTKRSGTSALFAVYVLIFCEAVLQFGGVYRSPVFDVNYNKLFAYYKQ